MELWTGACCGQAVMRMGLGCRAEFGFAFLVCLFPTLAWGQTTQLLFLFLALIAKLLPVCPENIVLGAST